MNDRDYARAVHHAAYRDVVERQFGSWDGEAQDRFFEGDWDGRENSVVLLDGAPCGYCAIEYRDNDVHLRELVIAIDFQRRGVGSAIIRSLQSEAATRGVPVLLGTLHKNEARALYERLGFVEFESSDTHILMKWLPR